MAPRRALLFLKPEAPGSGGGQLPLQMLHVPAQGLDGLHERLVCHASLLRYARCSPRRLPVHLFCGEETI